MNSLVFALILCVVCSCSAQQANERTHIDVLTGVYLKLQKALWQIIRGGIDKNTALQRIHDTHLAFYTENFNERGVPFTQFDPDQKILHSAINQINLTLEVVNDMYLHSNAEDYKRDQTIGFANHGINMTQHMAKIYNVTNNNNFFQFIERKGALQSCMVSESTIKSTNQMIFDYYNDISAAQLKAFTLVQLSYMFLTVYDVENYVMQAQELEYRFKQRNLRTQEQVKDLLSTASREMWMCDPDDPQVDGYSDQVTRLVQGYIDNEVNLNSINDCKKTCPDYKVTENFGCYNGSYCASTHNNYKAAQDSKCNGVVLDCDFVSTDMTICPSTIPHRRYDHINYDCGVTFGQDNGCTEIATRSTSWTRWFVQCTNCFCYCDEKGPNSDRYFSLKPVLSDISRNMVITGVAIRKHNRIFFWQITEKQLINNGEVNTTHPSWNDLKPGHYFSINDNGITEGTDYHTLTWLNRTINLDVLIAPPGKVVTGVRFNVDKGSLKLEIMVTKFDFNTGRLWDIQNSEWISNRIYEKTPIVLDKPNISTKALSKSIPDINTNKFIEFQPTDRHADAAQTTVPFIDIQLVQPANAVPLSGIGIYYKGEPFFGGYVAPKVITYDNTPYIGEAE